MILPSDSTPDGSQPVPSSSQPTGGLSEPEELIGQALYLMQLIQQDLNMGRVTTVWARAKRAKEACAQLQQIFKP